MYTSTSGGRTRWEACTVELDGYERVQVVESCGTTSSMLSELLE